MKKRKLTSYNNDGGLVNLLHPYFPCQACVLLKTEHCIFLPIKLGQRQQHHLFDIFRAIAHPSSHHF